MSIPFTPEAFLRVFVDYNQAVWPAQVVLYLLALVIMRRIVAKAGGDTDTTQDYEYTDRSDLREFARAFAQRLERSHAASTVS